MSAATFEVKENRQSDNETLRRLILAGSLMAESSREGRQDLATARCWEIYLKRWQDENQLKKIKHCPTETTHYSKS